MADTPKVSRQLEATLESVHSEDLVELVVELAPAEGEEEGLSRAERIAARKDAFDRDAGPVAEAIQGAGGEVVGRAWINQTLMARVPRRAVEAVAELEKVTQLDCPHAIELEGDH